MSGVTIKTKVHFRSGPRSKKQTRTGAQPHPAPRRLPRVAKLMALAVRFEGLLNDGIVANQAELATLRHVSRARVTQITNLLNLAPDVQEAILFLPPVEQRRDPLSERDLRGIVAIADWRKQREQWRRCIASPWSSMTGR